MSRTWRPLFPSWPCASHHHPSVGEGKLEEQDARQHCRLNIGSFFWLSLANTDPAPATPQPSVGEGKLEEQDAFAGFLKYFGSFQLLFSGQGIIHSWIQRLGILVTAVHWSYKDKQTMTMAMTMNLLIRPCPAMAMKITMTNTLEQLILAMFCADFTKRHLHKKKPVTLLCLCMCSI